MYSAAGSNEQNANQTLVLTTLLDILNAAEKGKPAERWGRKASGLRDFPTTAGSPLPGSSIVDLGASEGLFRPCHVLCDKSSSGIVKDRRETRDRQMKTHSRSNLADLAAYNFYYGTESGRYVNSIRVDIPGIASYVIENLIPDTYYFVATAVNSRSIESSYSNEATKQVL